MPVEWACGMITVITAHLSIEGLAVCRLFALIRIFRLQVRLSWSQFPRHNPAVPQ